MHPFREDSRSMFASWSMGKVVGDMTITWEENKRLMADLLYVDAPPTGTIRLTDWQKRTHLRLAFATPASLHDESRNES
jgi:hypothetical protein